MLRINKSTSLLFVFPAILVLFLSQKHFAADTKDAEEFYRDEITAAAYEVFWVMGLFFGVVLFARIRRRFKGKPTTRVDKLDNHFHTMQRAAHHTQTIIKDNRVKKHVSNVDVQALRKSEECERLTELVHSLSKDGDIPGAAKAMRMLEDACGTPGLQLYARLIIMCSKANDAQGAHLWLSRLQSKGHSPSAKCFNAVVHAHAKHGDVSKAIAVAGEMRDAGIDGDTVTYNTIIDAFTRRGDAAGAQDWMKKMLEAGVKASVISFGSVMCACAKAGLNNDLEYWVEQADALGIELNTICFSAVINAFAKRGDIDSADGWLTRMTQCNVSPSLHCFRSMLIAVCKNDDLGHAARILGRMRSLGINPDAKIYDLLVVTACQAGKLECAQQWINEASGKGVRFSTKTKHALLALKLTIPWSSMPLSDKIAIKAPAKGEVDEAAVQDCVGKRFVGTIKDFISKEFGHIVCNETYGVFKRDVFLCPRENPEQFAKGQRVSFVLQLDRSNGMPSACELKVVQK